MKRKKLFSNYLRVAACSLLMVSQALAENPKKKQPELPVMFIENKGQIKDPQGLVAKDVLYNCQIGSSGVFFQKNKVSYIQYNSCISGNKDLPMAHRVDVEFLNASLTTVPRVTEQCSSTFNFYCGGDNPTEATGIKGFKTLTYSNIYPNIDLVYTLKNNQLKYDLVVHPGGDLSAVKFKVTGADGLSTTDKKVSILTSLGNITDEMPVSYYLDKTHTKANVKIKQAGNVLSFVGKNINPAKTLVVDPQLVFFNNFGPGSNGGSGFAESVANSVEVNQINGRVLIVGYSNSTIFALAPGRYGLGLNSSRGFVSCFDVNDSLLWSSTLETNNTNTTPTNFTKINDVFSFPMLQAEITVCGQTSNGLPMASNSYGGGTSDGFSARFNNSGVLQTCFYIGGTNEDAATCITNGLHLAQVTTIGGYSYSHNLNNTNPYYTSAPNSNTTSLNKEGFLITMDYGYFTPAVAYRFIGSGQDDEITDVEFKSTNSLPGTFRLYATGVSKGASAGFFPAVTSGLSANSTTGDNDVFVLSMDAPHINNGPTSFVAHHCTFLGTDASSETVPQLDVTFENGSSTFPNNEVYVSFVTNSWGLNSLTTQNAFQKNYPGGNKANFFATLNYQLNSINYASYVNPAVPNPFNGTDLPLSISCDWLGNKYLCSITDNSSFFTTDLISKFGNVPGTPSGNGTDIFLTRLNPDYSLGFQALTGADINDFATAICAPKASNFNCKFPVYITGASFVSTSPLTAPVQPIHCKISDNYNLTLTSSNTNQLPSNLSILNQNYFTSSPANPTFTIKWYFNGNEIQNPAVNNGGNLWDLTATLPGDYYAVVTVGGCEYRTGTIHFEVDCEGAANYNNLKQIVGDAINMNITSIVVNGPTKYKIDPNDLVDIPNGITLQINNALVVGFPCSGIRVQNGGQLIINNSALTACDNWRGIYTEDSNLPASVQITNSGISNAMAGVFANSPNSSPINLGINISGSYFNNNNRHLMVNHNSGNSTNNMNLANSSINVNSCNLLQLSPAYYCESYTELPPSINPLIDYVILNYIKGQIKFTGNYFLGIPAAGNVVGYKGKAVQDLESQADKFRGVFETCSSMEDGANITYRDDDIKCVFYSYGIGHFATVPTENFATKVLNCNITNDDAINNSAIGISISSNSGMDRVSNNSITNCQNGVEFFNGQQIPSISDRSYIELNTIQDCRSGIVVSYEADPYSAMSGQNNQFHTILVWLKCNTFTNCKFGILGSGTMMNQLEDNIGNEFDAGNIFSCSDWDIIWRNNGTPGFIYLSPPTNVPNSSVLLSYTVVILNGVAVGGCSSCPNDFTSQTVYTSTGRNIIPSDCLPSPKPAKDNEALAIASENTFANDRLIVYPNPTSNLFSVHTLTGASISKIEVFDAMGRLIYSETAKAGTSDIQVNSNNWSSGIYTVKVLDANQVSKTLKLSKTN